jgi:hypothetical protein
VGTLALLGLLAAGPGCGGGTNDGPAPGAEVPAEPVPKPTPNRAPVLGTVSAASPTLDEGGSTNLSVAASDPEGDALTYTWTQSPVTPVGTFRGEAGAARTWTAPLLSRDTAFTLKVTVSDGKGGTAQGSVAVKVVNVAALNQAPVVDEDITVDASRFSAGRDMTFFIGARDRDGDALTYAWTTVPEGQGVFSNPERSYSDWHSDEVSAATDHTLRVTVSDGTASVTRSVKVLVTVPSYANDIEPIWSAKCADCHNPYGAEKLNLLAGQSHASLVNVAATQGCRPLARVTPGSPGGSLLMRRLEGTTCGNRMPQGNGGYFDDHPGELIQIRSWILGGARDD